MSQSDFAIPNAPGAVVLAAFNEGLRACGTLSSGPRPPASTRPFALWFSTLDQTLYRRDRQDAIWIGVWKFDGADVYAYIDAVTATASRFKLSAPCGAEDNLGEMRDGALHVDRAVGECSATVANVGRLETPITLGDGVEFDGSREAPLPWDASNLSDIAGWNSGAPSLASLPDDELVNPAQAKRMVAYFDAQFGDFDS